jgi:hypothetical protein
MKKQSKKGMSSDWKKTPQSIKGLVFIFVVIILLGGIGWVMSYSTGTTAGHAFEGGDQEAYDQWMGYSDDADRYADMADDSDDPGTKEHFQGLAEQADGKAEKAYEQYQQSKGYK